VFYKLAYGLNIDSEFDIGEFRSRKDRAEPHVIIRKGRFPIPRKPRLFCQRKVIPYGTGILMYWKGVGYFLMEEGTGITVMPDERYNRPGVINSMIIGPCLGVILYQRNNHYIFHSAVVGKRDGKGSLCLMGRKGDGKSTLATALCNRGYSLVSDDLLVLEKKYPPLTVQSGFPGMKLWASSAKALLQQGEELPMIGGKGVLEKRIRPMVDNYIEEPQTLGALFLLDYDDSLSHPKIESLSEVEVLREILGHWYGALFKGELLPLLGNDRHFTECSFVARNAPVFRLSRPFNMEKLSETVDIIDDFRESNYM
jgi:hypothetical protein